MGAYGRNLRRGRDAIRESSDLGSDQRGVESSPWEALGADPARGE